MNLLFRRSLCALIIIIVCVSLGGCGLRQQAREVEQLLVIETLGFDRSAQGVRLSMASSSSSGTDGQPRRLQGEAASVTAAIECIRASISEEELFCPHVGHLLVGEAAARRGLAPLLDYITRAGELRLSVPIYVLREREACEAVLRVRNAQHGICDALRSVDSDLRTRGDGHTVSAAELMRDLARRGSALLCAVELQPSSENDQSAGADEPPLTVVAAGYAVCRDGRLIGYLDREQAIAVGLLCGQSGLCEIVVNDQAGLPVTLHLTGGSTALHPSWDAQGELISLELQIEVQAQIREDAAGATELYYLRGMLERTLAEQVRQVLCLSKQWEADFLGLEEQLSLRASERLGAMEPGFAERWASLPVTVSVSATLTGLGDTEGGA